MDWATRADKAANFLTETDEQLAGLKVKHERDKRKAKRVYSAILLRVEGTVSDRQAQAETHADYQSAQAAEMTSLLELEKLKNKRDSAHLVVDFWRSWQKAKTQGVI